MIFIFILQWINYWYKTVLLPLLKMPFFYFFVIGWIIFAFAVSWIYVVKLDKVRAYRIKKELAFALIKSILLSLLCITIFPALYNYSISLLAGSDLFKAQQSDLFLILLGLNIFNIVLALILGLVLTPTFSSYFVSDLMYHFHDHKIRRRYFLLISFITFIYLVLVGLSLYLLFIGLGSSRFFDLFLYKVV